MLARAHDQPPIAAILMHIIAGQSNGMTEIYCTASVPAGSVLNPTEAESLAVNVLPLTEVY